MTNQVADTPPSDSELEVGVGGWASVTWDDIREWAGSRNVVRGRSYQRKGLVKNVVLSGDGRLMATVVGNDTYQASVWRVADKSGGDSLESHCTCPVGHNRCKHAVAVIAEYFKSLDDSPAGGSGHERRTFGESPRDNSDLGRIVPLADRVPPVVGAVAPPPAAVTELRGGASSWDGSLKESLRSKSHEELVDLVCSLLQRFSELRAEVRDRIGGTPEPPGA